MRFLRGLSFRTKLLFSVIFVIVLTTALGYIIVHVAVDWAFRSFVVEHSKIQGKDLFQLAIRYLEQAKDKDELLNILRKNLHPPIVVDESGKVVYAPDPNRVGDIISPTELSAGTRITLKDGSAWVVLPFPPSAAVNNPLEARFFRTVKVSLWAAGLLALSVGIGVGFLLLRQLTDPLNRLTAAARSLAKREFGQRVQVNTEDELGRLTAAFNEMADSLDRAEKAKKRMIVDVSHELRTPLSVVRNGLEGLRDGVIEPTPENLAALHNKVMLTTRLVDDLHQLALADTDRLMIHPALVDLRRLIDEIEKPIAPELEDRGIRFSIEVFDPLPPVRVDASRVEQVFLNLLANAIRYTESGGEIKVAVRQVDEMVETSVCNSGVGLSDEALEHIFDRFYRADPARARESGGSGLGLAIAKAIVKAHGGKIWAENTLQGPCFRFTLPRG